MRKERACIKCQPCAGSLGLFAAVAIIVAVYTTWFVTQVHICGGSVICVQLLGVFAKLPSPNQHGANDTNASDQKTLLPVLQFERGSKQHQKRVCVNPPRMKMEQTKETKRSTQSGWAKEKDTPQETEKQIREDVPKPCQEDLQGSVDLFLSASERSRETFDFQKRDPVGSQ